MTTAVCSRGAKTCRGAVPGQRNPAAPGRRWCAPCLAWSRDHEKKRRDACLAHGPAGDCSYCRKVEAFVEKYRDEYREQNLRTVCRRHGITPDDYYRMLEEQGAACAICRQPEIAFGNPGPSGRGKRVKRLAIDHCHVGGQVRGLLCNNCNRAIGMFKDDPAVLQAAIAYLEKHA